MHRLAGPEAELGRQVGSIACVRSRYAHGIAASKDASLTPSAWAGRQLRTGVRGGKGSGGACQPDMDCTNAGGGALSSIGNTCVAEKSARLLTDTTQPAAQLNGTSSAPAGHSEQPPSALSDICSSMAVAWTDATTVLVAKATSRTAINIFIQDLMVRGYHVSIWQNTVFVTHKSVIADPVHNPRGLLDESVRLIAQAARCQQQREAELRL
jgi:hypothetical protein